MKTIKRTMAIRFGVSPLGAVAGLLFCARVASAQGAPPAAVPPTPADAALPGTAGEERPVSGPEVPAAPPPVAGEPSPVGAVYAPPPPPPPPPPPAPPAAAPTRANVTGKFSTELYGFVEFDSILDSRQVFNEISGNAVLPPKSGNTIFAGTHRRLTFSGRNSRLGFKIKGGDTELIHPSAIIEMDFLGNQPAPLSEAAFFTNPTFRIRHMALKVETPYIDVLAGQYWQLFGWQSYFFPNSVEIMGLPGQVFGRAPQVRVSHAFKTDDLTVDLAVAASRPPLRDGGLPDLQGGIRLLINKWKGLHTANSTGTAIDAAGIGVSGVYRQLQVNEFATAAASLSTRKANAGGISVDVLLPIVPATVEDKAFALTLTGSYVRGTGIADLFTGLTGGVTYPALPNPMMTTPGPAYTPNIDPGLATYTPGGDLHSIDWQSIMGGLQLSLLTSGRLWVSANASQLNSTNIDLYATAPARTFNRSRFVDGNVFVDVTKAVRVGAEVAWFNQRFIDGSTADTYRYQLSGFYLF